MKTTWRIILLGLSLASALVMRPRIGLGSLDEGAYLFLGARDKILGDWSPIYSIWYSVLFHLLPSDAILVNLVSTCLISFVLVPMIFFELGSAIGFGPRDSLILGLIGLTSALNLPSDPHLHVFNFVALAGLSLAFLKIESSTHLLVASLVFAMLPYLRPENAIFEFFVLLPLWLQRAFHVRRKNSLGTGRVAAVCFAALSLSAAEIFLFERYWGPPLSEQRLYVAFLDHYFANHFSGPTAKISRMQVWTIFGTASTYFEALFVNSSGIFEHALYNLKRYPACFFEWSKIFPAIDHFLPDSAFARKLIGYDSLLLYCGLVLVAPQTAVLRLKESRFAFAVLALFGLMAVLESLMLSPRMGYSTNFMCSLYVLGVFACVKLRSRYRLKAMNSGMWLTCVACLLAAQTGLTHNQTIASFGHAIPNLKFALDFGEKKEMTAIRSLNLPPGLTSISDGQQSLYYDRKARFFTYFQSDSVKDNKFDFLKKLADEKIDIVFMTPEARFRLYSYGQGPNIESFEKSPGRFGYDEIYADYATITVYRRVAPLLERMHR